MYSVSKAFQEAIRQTYRQTRVYGIFSIYSANNSVEEKYEFAEDTIVQNSLVITDQMANGKFGYGGAYIRNMNIKLDCNKINNLNPININLTNATVRLYFYITLENGKEESVFLGTFYINSKESSRKFNILSLVGEDYLTKFDVTSEVMESVSPYQVYKRACELAGAEAATPESQIKSFPNGDLYVSFGTSQIQSARDMLMWVAKLTGTIARVKRNSLTPAVELIQIPIKYTQSDTDYNFDLDTFKEDNGSIIAPDTRFKTNYTDTSIRITTVFMNRKDERIEHIRTWTFAPDTLEGTMEIESNPILSNCSTSEVQEVVNNICQYTQHLRFCPFEITFSGNPAIEVGDFVYLEPGGGIDDTTYRHYGIVTYYKWIYNGNCSVRCSSNVAAERPVVDTPSTFSVLSNEPTAQYETVSEGSSIAPKSQMEKAANRPTDRLVYNDMYSAQLSYGRLDFNAISSANPYGVNQGYIFLTANDLYMIKRAAANINYLLGMNISDTFTRISPGGVEISTRQNGTRLISINRENNPYFAIYADEFGNQPRGLVFEENRIIYQSGTNQYEIPLIKMD